jgi:hypothetical protein
MNVCVVKKNQSLERFVQANAPQSLFSYFDFDGLIHVLTSELSLMANLELAISNKLLGTFTQRVDTEGICVLFCWSGATIATIETSFVKYTKDATTGHYYSGADLRICLIINDAGITLRVERKAGGD